MLKPLLPKTLNENDSAFKTVDELHEVLKKALDDEGEIKNVALTGPFGSGKSSILQTLRKKYKDEFEFLPISLATLQAEESKLSDNDLGNDGNKQNIETSDGSAKLGMAQDGNIESGETKVSDKDNYNEKLNRKIEYSILQQLIYREKSSTVQNSRFKRIIHIDEKDVRKRTSKGIGFLLAYAVAFEPSWLKVDTLYNFFNFGWLNIVGDIAAIIYMLVILYQVFNYLVKTYGNSRLNKLNLKDGEIEIKEDKSIFNHHLDEILYFFQVTAYNVVIIEDLDRFNTPDIFLKLRELNLLINESKIIDRKVVFMYAVKDDVFINEARTKFFDYITTVIPVINPSNSKVKLKKTLAELGIEDGLISDGDLADMAFFIQDMRILTNIANEFYQYKEKLCTVNGGQNLNMTKLLAMIVYKNYHPQDFALLHKREGKIHHCIQLKAQFIQNVLSKEISDKQNKLDEEYQEYLKLKHLQEEDLRFKVLFKVSKTLHPGLTRMYITDRYYSIEEISKNENLFNTLLKQEQISYEYNYYYSRTSTSSDTIDFESISSSMDFTKKLSLIRIGEKGFERKRMLLQKERLSIRSLKLKDLITKYNQGNSDLYKKIGLSEMMDVFIRRGFIDENYYDYISYFYEGMMSYADRDLLLSIKRDLPKEYTYHIDKVDNFVKELQSYMFDTNAILNNDLLDYLAKHKKHEDSFIQVMARLEREEAPLDFLSQYYSLGKAQEKVFTHFIEWDEQQSWKNIESWKNSEEKDILKEGWLKYSNEVKDEPLKWLNENYNFITERKDNIGIERCKNLVRQAKFEQLNNGSSALLDCIIDESSYSINSHNLCLITNSLLGPSSVVTEDDLNLTRIASTHKEKFIEHIKENIDDALSCFSETCKDESATSILYILNNETISQEKKEKYLLGQKNPLNDTEGITNEELINLAYKLFLLSPTWENVLTYFHKESKDEGVFKSYIEKYATELSHKTLETDETNYRQLSDTLIGSNQLNFEAYELIINSFKDKIRGEIYLTRLEPKRLSLLLAKLRLPFCNENTEIFKGTDFYVDYLIYHHKEFLANKNETYISNFNVAEKLLSSNQFSFAEKKELIKIIPEEFLFESQKLIDLTVGIFAKVGPLELKEDLLIELLQKGNYKADKVNLAASLIKTCDIDRIETILKVLGDEYKEIAERIKYPILKDSLWNLSLVSSLSERGFISSYKREKDGIRVYPRKQI